MGRILDLTCEATQNYLKAMPKSERKKIGQFFTSKETAMFMAELFDIPKDKRQITVLDAGAGTGVLSVAVIEKLEFYNSIEDIKLVCYETDANIIELLEYNLKLLSSNSKIKIEYKIITENYILSQGDDFSATIFANTTSQKYDIVIGNPPYLKISKDAPEAKSMPSVCYGAPNLYFLFTSMALFNLRTGGELVYIIPRSWTSGAYFKKFREYLLTEGSLEHIHLFVSRDKVFKNENVLQETMIIKVRKTPCKSKTVTITASKSSMDFGNKTLITVPYDIVVSESDLFVFLVTDLSEIEVLKKLNKWSDTLPSLGLKMKTGLTVDFRNKEYLRTFADKKSVPLFYSQHMKDGKIVFPIGKENEFINTEQSGLLQKNCNYLFVKRFTAKEEARRLQCAIYLSKKFADFETISTQNKINFIAGMQELSECVVYGLYVIFNSSIYDLYYRILNGSTQVNSTEINTMPMPAMDLIERMGRELIKVNDMSEQSCNLILRSYI